MKLYTKVGDYGTTSLPGRTGVRKDSDIVELVGALDELQVSLGRVSGLNPMVPLIRKTIWKLSGEVVGYNSPGGALVARGHCIEDFEHELDRISVNLTNFVGFTTVPALYYDEARVRCRRVERCLVRAEKSEYVAYFNRLSDLLFAWAVLSQPDVQTFKATP